MSGTVGHSVSPPLRAIATCYAPTPYGGHFGIARSVRLSVPWRSCLGYRHVNCLQLSHRQPPGMCATADPSADGRRSAAIFPANCHRRGGGHIVSPPRCDRPTLFILVSTTRDNFGHDAAAAAAAAFPSVRRARVRARLKDSVMIAVNMHVL